MPSLLARPCYVCSELIGWGRRTDKITCSKKCKATLQRRRDANKNWRFHIPESYQKPLKLWYSERIERIGILYGHQAVMIALDCIHDETVKYQNAIKDIDKICKHIETD